MRSTIDRRLPILPWVALVTVWVVWGSTYLGISYAVDTLPPLLMSGTRFLVAGTILLAVMGRHLTGAGRPTLRQLRSSVIVGAALLFAGNGLLSISEQHLDSGLAALLVTTTPLMMIVLRAVQTRTRVSVRNIIAMALGTTGVLVLVGAPATSIDVGAVVIVLGASLAWAAGSVYSKGADQPAHPFVATAVQMLAGGLLLTVAGLAGGELNGFHPADVSTASLLGLAWLIVAGSLIGFSAYTYALKSLPTDKVATYAYVNPVIAIVLGSVIAHEPLSGSIFVGGAAVVAAVVVTLARRRRAAAADIEKAAETVDAPGEAAVLADLPGDGEVGAERLSPIAVPGDASTLARCSA